MGAQVALEASQRHLKVVEAFWDVWERMVATGGLPDLGEELEVHYKAGGLVVALECRLHHPLHLQKKASPQTTRECQKVD